MRNVIIGFAIATLLLAFGMTTTACNIIDPGDMEELTDALARVPKEERQRLEWETKHEKAIEALKKKPTDQEIGRFLCLPTKDAGGWDGDYLDRAEAERPTVQDVIDCLENGISKGAKTWAPEDVDYTFCVRMLLNNAARKEEIELLRLAKSDSPWDYYIEWPVIVDLRGFEFVCSQRTFEEFEGEAIYEQKFNDKTEIKLTPPMDHEPIRPEDTDDDDDIFDNTLARDKRIIMMLLSLGEAPPIVKDAVKAGAAAGAFSAFVKLVCMGAGSGWGCASAPGLPGFNGAIIVSPADPGGDK